MSKRQGNAPTKHGKQAELRNVSVKKKNVGVAFAIVARDRGVVCLVNTWRKFLTEDGFRLFKRWRSKDAFSLNDFATQS